MVSARTRILTGAIGASIVWATPAHASKSGWANASDVGRDVLFYTALGYPAERSSAICLRKNSVELRSTGQPRAAVPRGHLGGGRVVAFSEGPG
jgi:hypothetical protein